MSCSIFLSAELFWGFTIHVDMNEIELYDLNQQSECIQNKFKNELKIFFLKENLQILAEKVDVLQIHLHERLKVNEINYACDHCHGNQS